MFAVCLLLLLDALLRIRPLPSRSPRGGRALTGFNSHRQLRVFPSLRAAPRAPGLRFSRQVHPFLGVKEQAFAQQLHAALLLGLRGNLGRRLRRQEGVFQHRDLGHPPGRGRPGHPPLGRRPRSPEPGAGRGGAGLGTCGRGGGGGGRRLPSPGASRRLKAEPWDSSDLGTVWAEAGLPFSTCLRSGQIDAQLGTHFPTCSRLAGSPISHILTLLSSLSHILRWAGGHFPNAKFPERSAKTPSLVRGKSGCNRPHP